GRDGHVWFLHPIYDPFDTRRLSRIVSETTSSRAYRHFPQNAVAIFASDDESNQLVLVQAGDRIDDILYAWDHDTAEVTCAANDFAELTPVTTRSGPRS